MSSVYYGDRLKISIFGQSHTPAIGVTIDGLPAGFPVDLDVLAAFLQRRAPGQSLTTPRKEADVPEFLCGLHNGKTCGAPLTVIIRNTNTRSADYAEFARKPRPGHADFTASVKYGGAQDPAGGGHFSGRLTAPMCIAGGICLQMLRGAGVRISAHLQQIGAAKDRPFDPMGEPDAVLDALQSGFPTLDPDAAAAMQAQIRAAAAAQDSVGGVVECIAQGVPAGWGDPMFDGIENRIARVVFAIPAVKGLEFGLGFAAAAAFGSTVNDPFCCATDGSIRTRTNAHGGCLGGISSGMPVVFRAAFKPTPSIARPQQTVDLVEKTDTMLEIRGRHDPCVAVRAVPVVEAAAAIALADAMLAAKMD